MSSGNLPTASEALASAWYATMNGGDYEAARLALDIARELREGSRAPEPPTEKAVREALQAYDATTYGDLAVSAAETAIIHVPQPAPVPNDRGSIQALVRQDLVQRERLGVERYGTPLQAFNGRDALRDAYEEALDLACYLKQALVEGEAS